ncbi:hypothetical protein HKB02_07885 [Vibrio parahaemolyticus]|uniref:hypothetical protein n=2 Tax=Vibrio parahaemolyticus TaxID=670 RepID=UPI001469A424|nr:hypothetical protein [Vibrio parahaemolyticus]MDF5124298.1 hypothetical protein [Vibrio parahaemolyticus]NMT57554.1 hypothetical protein [Vibrio parahaemolyticus]
MKKVLLSLIAAAFVPGPAFADQLDVGLINFEKRNLQINTTIQKLYQLEAAVTAYYLEFGGFPTSLDALTTGSKPFFNGSLQTPIGAFSSKLSANSFELVFNPHDSTNDTQVEMMSYIASLTASNVQGTAFEYFVPAPQSNSIVKNMLNRVDDSNNGNRMLTDLSMGGNDITDIKKLFAAEVELSDALNVNNLSATSMTLDQLNSSIRAQISGSAVLGNANFSDFTVNNDATANNLMIQNLVTTNAATGSDVTADSFTSATVKAVDASIAEINGDTATIEKALFTQSATASTFNVAKTLETDEVQVDVIRGYNAVPINFTSKVEFADVVLNAPLKLNDDFTVNANATLADTTMQSLALGGALTGLNVDVNKNLTAQRGNISRGARINGSLNARDVFATNADFSNSVNVVGNTQISGALKVGNQINQNGRLISNGTTLYSNGSSLDSLLLGRNSTAFDASKIDGYGVSQLAQRNQSNVFGGTQTFKKDVNVSGNVYVNGRLVVDSSGNLYDGGQAIRNVYASQTEAATLYKGWDKNISELRSSLEGELGSLESYSASVKSQYQTALAKANTQKTTLDSLGRSFHTITERNADTNDKISTLISSRKAEESKLTSAVKKLDSGPTYQNRSCSIVTTRTETGVDTNRFTENVIDYCQGNAVTQTKTAQYGTLN